jgi:hypothetical protein
MGIKSASKIISSCKNLTVKDIKDALNAVIQQQHNVDENEPSAPSLSEDMLELYTNDVDNGRFYHSNSK